MAVKQRLNSQDGLTRRVLAGWWVNNPQPTLVMRPTEHMGYATSYQKLERLTSAIRNVHAMVRPCLRTSCGLQVDDPRDGPRYASTWPACSRWGGHCAVAVVPPAVQRSRDAVCRRAMPSRRAATSWSSPAARRPCWLPPMRCLTWTTPQQVLLLLLSHLQLLKVGCAACEALLADCEAICTGAATLTMSKQTTPACCLL